MRFIFEACDCYLLSNQIDHCQGYHAFSTAFIVLNFYYLPFHKQNIISKKEMREKVGEQAKNIIINVLNLLIAAVGCATAICLHR